MKNLTAREELFASFYAYCRNGREAAARAGYTVCPVLAAKKLLSKPNVREAAKSFAKELESTQTDVKAGLQRVAFSSSADAIKLLLCGENEKPDPEKLDLFNVSEIKRQKGGGLEIKFFDRIKALEKLGDLTAQGNSEKNTAASFYDALEQSAKINGEAE